MKTWFEEVPALLDGKHLPLLEKAYAEGTQTYPPKDKVFHALDKTALTDVKVVIIGQDPYHQPGQAEGLAFSVPEGVKMPPSLRNILREVNDDLYNGEKVSVETQLDRWAEQGVLLLNTTLTVQDSKAGAHAKWGWQFITDDIVRSVSEAQAGVVFLLWGAHAHSKSDLVDENKHLVLKSVHPSPLSASRGFFGCKHFSQCNDWLKSNNQTAIKW